MSGSTSTSLAQALWAWLRTCPELRQNAKVGMDYLADAATVYALYAVPSTIRTRANVLGEVVPADQQEQMFYFASKEPYGADTRQTLQNQSFYESIIAWIWKQTETRNFPEIPAGDVVSIVPTLTTLIADAGSDVAKYQIQLKLIYRRRE